jgi:hypothetical protein
LSFLHQFRFELFHRERINIPKDTVTIILRIELNALINTCNKDKISEADKLIILDGKFFIKLPELLRAQRSIRAADGNLTRVTVMTIAC